MTRLALVLRTLDRTPKANYLGTTLANRARSGLWQSPVPFKLTLVDSGSPDPHGFLAREAYPHVPQGDDRFAVDLPPAGRVRTHNENATRAVEIAVLQHPDYMLMLEDDIDVCDRFLESVVVWLAEHARPDVLLYAFGANYAPIDVLAKQGYTSWKYPIDAFYGAQCYAVARQHLAHLAEWLGRHLLYKGRTPQCHDLLLHDWAKARNPHATHFLASAPSFVDHIGRESALDNKYFHFSSWPGPEWTYQGLERA